MSNTTSTSRRHDLDWLRVLAFATLILYHVGMFYVTWDWHVKSDFASTFIEPLMSLVNPWRLGLLFFISGVALRFLIDSRRPRAVIGDRLSRFLIPLTFGMLVVVMPQAYFELRADGEIGPSMLEFYGPYLLQFDAYSIITPTWNHLWFLAYALVYSLLLAALYPVLQWVGARVGPAVSNALQRAPWLVLVVPAVPVAISAVTLDPIFPSTHMMVNDWADHARYLTVLLFGWYAAKSDAFWSAVRRCLILALVLVVSLGVLLTLARTGDPDTNPAWFPVARELYAWVVIAAVLGLAQRFLNRPSRALTYATEAVLPWYILHQTIIIAIGFWFIGSGVPLWLEATVIIVGTAVSCILIHELLIRRFSVMRRLFGLGPLRPRRAAASRGSDPTVDESPRALATTR